MDRQTAENKRALHAFKREVRIMEALAKEHGLTTQEVCDRLGVKMPENPTFNLKGLKVTAYRESPDGFTTIRLKAEPEVMV